MLLVALNSPELDILGITTTYGNTGQEVTYRKAHELLELTGRLDIPVLRGAEADDPLGKETEASRFIRRMAAEYPGEVSVLAVGPMTNVATAIHNSPETATNLERVISMGGNIRGIGVGTTQCWSDLNYGSDIASAGIFLESPTDLTIISIQVSERFYVSRTRYQRLITETRYRDYLSENTRLWYYLRRRFFVLWDLVALACLVHPEWFEPNEIDINYVVAAGGEPKLEEVRSAGFARVNVPYFQEDQLPFWEWFFSRI
jgi:inosine-uridine nucleoside N-ribohydrolase